MTARGINTVRTYTVPPEWLLDLAGRHALRVLVGIPWQQHTAFLDHREVRDTVRRTVRDSVRLCRGHESVLGYVIGNEIPPGIVRWHGRRRIERFLETLYRVAKQEDPVAVVTYANYPSTEYLQLPFLDVACFNVFLEEPAKVTEYLAHLQVIAGDRPLLIGELGLDSQRNGVDAQARSVAAQLRAAFTAGAAGCFVFAWTDEWHRSGLDVDDWDFGLVTRDRNPKPALESVEHELANVPFAPGGRWPGVSVIVCTHNGAQRIDACLRSLIALDYPDYEVIVIDDGSTDGSEKIAADSGVRVIATENRGLSAARNTGIEAAENEIIAFCDDDCAADPHWLRYLVATLVAGEYAGVGGPNVPPEGTVLADSIGHSPGGPMHVLVSDTEAEHIPGCNMAFHRRVLREVGGFDPRFRVAGDDVDLCWRIENAGGRLGFSPGAMVWHQPRASILAYMRQQRGYGRAEGLLERKWPDRYNGSGHVDSAGRIYGGKARRSVRRGWSIYYGLSGNALFQSVYSGQPRSPAALPLAPEWYLLMLALAVVSLLGLTRDPDPFWLPVIGLPAAPLLLVGGGLVMLGEAAAWARAVVLDPSLRPRRRVAIRASVCVLCLLQPLSRLWGRLASGLTPWRGRGRMRLTFPRIRRIAHWSEHWQPVESWAAALGLAFRREGADVSRGTAFDTWDFEVRAGALAASRVRLAVEEHGRGKQMVWFRIWPRMYRGPAVVTGLLGALALVAIGEHAVLPAVALALASVWLGCRMVMHAAAAVDLASRAVQALSVGIEPARNPEPLARIEGTT
jgi:GT2 family glycosyltransferase